MMRLDHLSRVLVLLLLLHAWQLSGYPQQQWMSATVNFTALMSAGAQNASYKIESWVRCVEMAIGFSWPMMACLTTTTTSGPECQLWSAKHVAVGKGVRSGALPHTPCKISSSYTGCIRTNGSMAAIGEKQLNADATTETCQDGGFVTDPITPKTTCSSNFAQILNVGCIYVTQGRYDWTAGSTRCMTEYSAEMYSADNDQEQQALSTHIKNTVRDDVWVMIRKSSSGTWQYLNSTYSPGIAFWKNYPTSSSNPCAKINNNGQLEDKPCTDSYLTVCRIRTTTGK
ncbi:uncharacterized protein LOC108668612 [Hyalella azteca]|uniref:Uncharacterized protein LOC108668612 n=1 Tax=Hyalella azteca TaxID=294128 RepID=A0A8B7NCM0_HYAAZ|nr:uncharacterized protein LOC108668612 [Hyalella azteca]XP_018011344.1 uncharacterized protein LOC108668612 [Hyalella azteca]